MQRDRRGSAGKHRELVDCDPQFRIDLPRTERLFAEHDRGPLHEDLPAGEYSRGRELRLFRRRDSVAGASDAGFAFGSTARFAEPRRVWVAGYFAAFESRASNTFAGTVALASGTATATFPTAYNSAPVRTANDTSAIATVRVQTSATALTLTQSSGTDTIAYICVGNPN
jgi:hypothetical protein